MLAPSAGSCRVLGLDPAGVPEKVHALSGVVTEHAQMYDNLSGMQNLLFYASIFGVPGAEAQERADSLLRQLELEEARDRRLSAYSTGMRQRLSLARALIHRPKVLFLDEPTSGLDPESAQNVNRLIQELAKQEGITVFLCTHQLRYAQEICTRYGLIEEGQLLAAGTLDELRRKVRSGAMLQICADNMPEKLPFQKAGAGQYEMTIQSDDEIPKIVRRIVLGGGDIFAVEVKKPSLEDIYFTLTAGKRGKHNEKCHDCCYQKGYSRCHGQQAFIRQPPGRPGGADCHPTHHLFIHGTFCPGDSGYPEGPGAAAAGRTLRKHGNDVCRDASQLHPAGIFPAHPHYGRFHHGRQLLHRRKGKAHPGNAPLLSSFRRADFSVPRSWPLFF